MTGVRLYHLGPLESPFAEVAEATGNRPPAELEGLPGGWPDIEASEAESLAARRREECARNWQKLRDGLPEEMQKALVAGEWVDVARWGIQHGIRDVNHLTDIIFWHQVGGNRGYCKLDPAEPKYAFWLGAWRLIREDVRKAFTDIRPLDQAGPTACVAHDKRPAVAQPDNPPVDITGRYEDHRATPRYTLRVNQAGNHVECLIIEPLLPFSDPRDRRPRREWRLSGDLKNPESKPYFELYDRAAPRPPVLLSSDAGTGALRISGSSAFPDSTAELLSRSPTLLEGALSGLDEKDLVRLYEQRPLTRHQIQHLQRSLRSAALTPLLQKFFDVDGDLTPDRMRRGEAVRPLLRYLEAVWDNPQHGIEEQDWELARFYARTILTLGKWTLSGHLTSLLDWLQLVVDRLTLDNGTPPTSDFTLTRLLGLTTRLSGNGGGGHTYKVSLTMSGGGLYVAGYVGQITVEKVGGDDGGAWKKGQKEHFSYWVVGMEGGGGIKPFGTIEGEATVPFLWQPPDFPGTIEIGKAGVGAYGVSAEGGFVHIHGRGYLPVMPVIFTSLDENITLHPTEKTLGLGETEFEIGPAGYLGKIRDRPFPKIDYTTFTVKTDYAVSYDLTKQVHFCLDSAMLSAEARRAIRVMCANELAGFGSPDSHLTIAGHTDRIAEPGYNLELSQLRADNTLLAVRDVLATRLRIPKANIQATGKGEELATKDGCPDKQVNPKYRRVDIILNGRLVLTLSAH